MALSSLLLAAGAAMIGGALPAHALPSTLPAPVQAAIPPVLPVPVVAATDPWAVLPTDAGVNVDAEEDDDPLVETVAKIALKAAAVIVEDLED